MTLQFWQGWPRNNRIFFLAFFVVFAGAMANMWVAYFVEPAPAIHLQTIVEAEVDEIPVDQISKGPFDFIVQGNNYVLLQRQLGSMLTMSETVSYTYLVFLAVFVIGMLAVISTLGRFYYLVGMGIFILFVTSLSFEILGVFGDYGKMFTVVVMALYGFASFWLFYFATATSYTLRVLIFTAITALLWAAIYFLSATEKPFVFIATHSVEAGLIACTLFIVTVAHEIVASFVFAVSQTTRSRKSLNHFLIISVIYIINLALAYSVRFGFIYWNVITVDLFLLLTISAILGVWGIRQRYKIYEGIIDADPYAVFAFLLMGAFTFATIAMFMYNANDTALSAISDVIIFTHIGFGFIFLTYVVSNFGGMLSQNMLVYKVLYSPTSMPFFTFRLAGLIATLAVVFYNAWQVPVHNAMSGYYNGIGDLYAKIENIAIARAYYDESRTYGFRGHHANYAIANIEAASFNIAGERAYYAEASGRRPTQMSFLNWAQTYQSEGNNLEAISKLTDGVKKLNDHEAIENTLGLLYARGGLSDSASKYLARSMASASFKTFASSNILGLAALRMVSLQDTTRQDGNDAVMNVNRIALANARGRSLGKTFELPADTVLTLTQAATISNYLINTRGSDDTTFVNKVVSLARRPSNSGFKEALLLASAVSLYHSGETKEAFTTLEEVTVGSAHQGRFNNILTMWALENNEPLRAVDYADYAMLQKYERAKPTYAVAFTELLPSNDPTTLRNAVVAWDSLRATSQANNDTINAVLATRIKNVLQLPWTMMNYATDEEKFIFARYRLSIADSNRVFELVPTIADDNVKAKVLLDFAQKCYALDKPSAALRYLQRIVGLELTDAGIGRHMQVLEMIARVKMGNASMVLSALRQEPVEFKGKDKKYRVYFDALAAEAAGDSTNANKYYHWLATANPYFEDGLIAAAKYFRGKGQTSYNALVDGLLHHPSSIRIKKAYALESARRGFDDYAKSAIAALAGKLDARDLAELSREVEELLAIARQ